jgi:hypothetical protein
VVILVFLRNLSHCVFLNSHFKFLDIRAIEAYLFTPCVSAETDVIVINERKLIVDYLDTVPTIFLWPR